VERAKELDRRTTSVNAATPPTHHRGVVDAKPVSGKFLDGVDRAEHAEE